MGESGSIKDRRQENPGRPRKVRTTENIEELKFAVSEIPQRSVRRILVDISNSASVISVDKMFKFDLKLVLSKISIMQHLNPLVSQDFWTKLNITKD